jgi:hypothetical protein
MSRVSGYSEEAPLQGFRSSFTVPHRQLSFHERAGLDKTDADAGLLFQHPSVRIFSFAPPAESIISSSDATHPDADYPIDTVETLPWRSRKEDLAASGPMIIEKISGSVPSLKCGHQFVRPILRNSQCWCVDGESKFVLRKGRLQYYRIELPNATEDDKAKLEELKAALCTVLKYEKTPCPFKRAFHVDLPDDAITPRRSGKWQRRDSSLLSSPDTSTPPPRKWRSSRPPVSQTPPTSFPDRFSKRRASDYAVESPTIPPRPVQLERRRSIAERRAAFENPKTPSEPPSRPWTPASYSSGSISQAEEGYESQTDDRQRLNEVETSLQRTPEPDTGTSGEEQLANVEEDDSREPEVSHEAPVLFAQSSLATETPESSSDVQDMQNKQPETEQENVADPPPNVVEAETADDLRSEMGIVPNSSLADANHDRDSLYEQLLSEVSKAPQLEEEQSDSLASPATTANPAFGHADTDAATNSGTQEPSSDMSRSQEAIPDDITLATAPLERHDSMHDDTESIASTADSFHTVDTLEDTTYNDTDPTPLAESFDPLGAKAYTHRRDVSEITVTASTYDSPPTQFPSSPDERPSTPKLVTSTSSSDSWPSVQTPPSLSATTQLHSSLRHRLQSRRSLSPLPPSPTLVMSSPPDPRNHSVTSSIQRAAMFAVVKPLEVVVLLVHVLARIAAGATLNDLLSGGLFANQNQQAQTQGRRLNRERGNRHARNPSFPDYKASRNEESDDEREDGEEDDFGIPIRGRKWSLDPAGSGVRKPSKTLDVLTEAKKEKERDDDVDSLFADDVD